MLSGLHLSDREHAGGPAARDLRRAGALLPGRAARHRAEGHRLAHVLAAAGGARASTPLAMLALASVRLAAGARLMQRLRCPRLEGVPRAAAESAALRHRRHRADHPADDARLRGDDRRPRRAGRGRGRRSLGRQPRADRPFRRLAELHASSTPSRPSGEIDPYLERGDALAGARDSCRATASAGRGGPPVAVQVVADGSDSNSTTVALGYATSLIGGYAQEARRQRRRRRRRADRGHRRARSASGSTRSSRAATS